mgnify:CR=1 FL=1
MLLSYFVCHSGNGDCPVKVLYNRKWVFPMSYRLSEAYINALQPYFNFFFYLFYVGQKISPYPGTMTETLLYKIDIKAFYFLSDSNKNLQINGFKLLQFKIGRL